MFEGAEDRQAWDTGRIEEVLGSPDGVLAHKLPFCLIEGTGFIEDRLGHKELSHVVKHRCHPHVMEQLAFQTNGHPLRKIENTDVNGVSESILIHFP